MRLVWTIRMWVLKGGQYKVQIAGEGGNAKGMGPNAYYAYRNAEAKLVIKPACEWIKP